MGRNRRGRCALTAGLPEPSMKSLNRLIFGAAGIVLMLGALALMVYGPASLVLAVLAGQPFERQIFRAIGYLIVAVAVFDVAKYILEEEAISEDERRNAAVTRRSLTKFASTIVIAVLLEGLVLTFEVAREEIEHVLYPMALLLCGTVLLVALGVFQRLSASTEQRVDEKDPEAAGPKAPGS